MKQKVYKINPQNLTDSVHKSANVETLYPSKSYYNHRHVYITHVSAVTDLR